MKALVKLKPEKGIWMADIPLPHVGINDVLIKIKKTAICGTDLHIYKWDAWAQATIPTPMHVGHEFVGEVVEIGTIPNQLFNNHYVVAINNCTGRSRTFYNSTAFSPEITSICLGDTLEAW
jgi:threonine dehydrogenase-like Zn-dependent dehydrogenase